eukprot:scaffold60894_cov45-Phaeocystis_antarctica.AAC.2
MELLFALFDKQVRLPRLGPGSWVLVRPAADSHRNNTCSYTCSNPAETITARTALTSRTSLTSPTSPTSLTTGTARRGAVERSPGAMRGAHGAPIVT